MTLSCFGTRWAELFRISAEKAIFAELEIMALI